MVGGGFLVCRQFFLIAAPAQFGRCQIALGRTNDGQ